MASQVHGQGQASWQGRGSFEVYSSDFLLARPLVVDCINYNYTPGGADLQNTKYNKYCWR